MLPRTTPDYVEASLTLAPDGAAPVFHMARLPDSVVFVRHKARELLSPIATFCRRLAAQTSTTGNNVYTAWPNNDTGMFSLQRAATIVKHRKTIVLSQIKNM